MPVAEFAVYVNRQNRRNPGIENEADKAQGLTTDIVRLKSRAQKVN
jgi:hypothetical protein